MSKKTTKTFTAENFWQHNPPDVRLKHVKGLHPLAYGARYAELTANEKSKVQKFIASVRE